MSSTTMSPSARVAYLRQQSVAILGVDQPGSAPLLNPVWFRYTDENTVHVCVKVASLKAKLVGQARAYSLIVQDPDPPYSYVFVAGPAATRHPTPDELRAVVERYKHGTELEEYLAARPVDRVLLLSMEPQRWLTHQRSDEG